MPCACWVITLVVGCWRCRWSRRQESNLYLALRRHSFYPLNYGEGAGQRAAFSHAIFVIPAHSQRHVQIKSSEFSKPDCARNVKRWAMR